MAAADPLLYLFPRLATVNTTSLHTKLYATGLTVAAYSVIYVVSYVVSHAFYTFTHLLRPKEKIFWALGVVRSVFGITTAFFGVWSLFTDTTLRADLTHGNSVFSYLMTYYCTGFFLFECAAYYLSCVIFKSFDMMLFLHHTLTLVSVCFVAHYEKGQYFVVAALLLEMTTPFTCLCWMLIKAKLADTTLWKANQFILVHLFHCRTIVEGYLLYISYWQWDVIWRDLPGPIFYMLYFQLPFQFFFLTPYWTWKKTSQQFNPIDWNHPEIQENGVKQEDKVTANKKDD